MRLVVDDPAFPMAWYLSAALGYLLGLAAVGYMAVLAFIRAHAASTKWPQWLTNVVVGLHATLGIGTFTLVPASLMHRLNLQGAASTAGGIAFAIGTASVLSIGLLIACGWNGLRPGQDNPAD
jgi:Na+-translocating ferredoxin:NAD+ oxidoreductase RnfA subunit